MGPDTYDLVSLLRDSYVDLTDDAARRAHRLLPRAQAGSRGAARVPPAVRPDGAAAQPEGARHLRLPDDEPGRTRSTSSTCRARCTTPGRTSTSYPRFARLRELLAATSTNCELSWRVGLHSELLRTLWPGAAAIVRRLDAPVSRRSAWAATTCSRSARTGSTRSSSSRRGRTSTTTTPTAVADLQQWLAEARARAAQRARADRRELRGRPLGRAADAGEHRRRRPRAGAGRGRARAAHRPADPVRRARRAPRGCRDRSSPPPADNSRDAARRSIEALQRLAAPLGVPRRARGDPERAVAAGLARALRRGRARRRPVGICLDFGHAHLDGRPRRRHRNGVRAPDRDARARQPRPDSTSTWCRSRAPSTGRRR